MLKIFGLALCIAFVLAAPQNNFEDDDDDLDDIDDFDFPSDITTCQIDTPDVDDCIKNSIQEQLPRLSNGRESLRIPPIDPLTIDSRTATIRLGESIRATGTARKVKIHGISKAQLLDFKSKITKTHISAEFTVAAKNILAEGYYRGVANFMDLKIKAKGFYNSSMDDVTIHCMAEGEIIKVKGIEYVKITHFDFTPYFGNVKMYADGFFPDPEISRKALDFANQYWPFFLNELLPQIKEIIEPMILEFANRFTLYVPLRKMLYYGDGSS